MASEADGLLRKVFRLLHSSDPNSATELRLLFDEIVIEQCGPEKTLTSQLSQRVMDMEKCFPNRANSPMPGSNDIAEDTCADVNLKVFGDLNCCVCGEMVYKATNRLIECSRCGALYHQECHDPPISDEAASEDQKLSWECQTCFNQPSTSRAAAAAVDVDAPVIISLSDDETATPIKSTFGSPISSTSSESSSSPFHKPELPATTTKHRSKSSREDQPSTSKSRHSSSTSSSSSSSKRSAHSKRSSTSKSSTSSSSKHRDSSNVGKHKSNK